MHDCLPWISMFCNDSGRRTEKKDGEWRAADGRPTDRVSHRLSRVDSETPVSNCPLSLPKPASQRVYECGGSKMMLPSSSPTQPAPFGSFLLCKSHHTPRLSVCGSPPSCIQPSAIHSQARRGARRGVGMDMTTGANGFLTYIKWRRL